jgi:hypothetical protein
MGHYLRKNDLARVKEDGRVGRVDDHGGLTDRGMILVWFTSGVSLWFWWNDLELYEGD